LLKRSSTKDVNQLAKSILNQVTHEAEGQPEKNPAAVALGRMAGLRRQGSKSLLDKTA